MKGFNMDDDSGASVNMLLQSAVQLLQGNELRENEEAMCELLETICNPNPPPQSWPKYGETLNEMGLLESMYRVMRTSKSKPRVLAYAAKALGQLAGQAEIIQTFMYSFPNLINELTEILEQHTTDMKVIGNVVYLLHYVTEVAGWHGKNKITRLVNALLSLIEGGFVYTEEDKAQVGLMWKLTWAVTTEVIGIYIQYSYRDEDVDLEWMRRVLGLVEKNFKHWECFYALTFFGDPMGTDVLRRDLNRAVKAIVKLLGWHAKKGVRCESKVCSEKALENLEPAANKQQENAAPKSLEEKRQEQLRLEEERIRKMEERKQKRTGTPKKRPNMKREGDWGYTMDLGLDLLVNLLLVAEKSEAKATSRLMALVPSALAKIDKYLVPNPNIDLSAAENALDKNSVATFNETGVVRLLMELLSSHMHYKNLVFKICNLMFVLTSDNEGFREDELFMEGNGPKILLKALEQDLSDESIKELQSHCTRFVAPLIILARRVEYKDAFLQTGCWDIVLVLLDRVFELGLQLLVYLQKGSNEVKRKLREELAIDERVITYAREAQWSSNPLVLKQVVDLLVGLKSPFASRLNEFMSPEMLVAMAYYWTPRDVGRQLLFDPNPEDTLRVVTHVLKNLELWLKAAWSDTASNSNAIPPKLLPVMEKGIVCMATTLLWACPDDSPVWSACVGVAFRLFRLDELGVQERLAGDFLRERKKAPFSPATLQRFKEYINHPSFDQGLWSFMESLFMPAFSKRGLDFGKEVIAPPPMIGGMQRSFGGVRADSGIVQQPEKGKYNINLDPEAKRCFYCHKANIALQRCGRCKAVFFCDRICQTRAWSDHKQSCK